MHVAAPEAAAQDTTRTRPPRRDTTVVVPIPQRADSAIVPDTTEAARIRADTLKTPFARAESPVTADVGLRYAWDRDAFFASGAITLLDLLERVPGLTGFRAGWSAAPMTASYLGVPGRVRIYQDGVELDALVTREGGMNDLSAIQLWQLEDVVVERGASEVRVFIRSWRHDRTTPYTRVDVFTGDEESNSYRGYYGRRWRNGMGLQVGAQQFSVAASPREGGAGDGLSIHLRLGWARGDWSIDGSVQSVSRALEGLEDGSRGATGLVLQTTESRDRMAMLRAAWRAPDRDGPWLQLIATGRHVTEIGARVTSASSGVPIDTVDTLRSRPQYVATAGFTRGSFRASSALRVRAGTGSGEALLSPAFRLSVDRRWLTATALAERVERFDDSTITRLEAIARISPTPWLSLAGAASREQGPLSLVGEGITAAGDEGQLSLRGELGVRLWRTWVSGGIMRREEARLPAPQLFYIRPAPAAESDSALTGAFVALRGPLWKAFGIDAYGVRWDREDGLYRPQWQSRTELNFSTTLPRRFPNGEFGFLFAAIHEYRSNVLFPSADGTEFRRSTQTKVLSTLLELRLQNAVISWQFRNLLGVRYTPIPGFVAHRPINVYGVRWEFWN